MSGSINSHELSAAHDYKVGGGKVLDVQGKDAQDKKESVPKTPLEALFARYEQAGKKIYKEYGEKLGKPVAQFFFMTLAALRNKEATIAREKKQNNYFSDKEAALVREKIQKADEELSSEVEGVNKLLSFFEINGSSDVGGEGYKKARALAQEIAKKSFAEYTLGMALKMAAEIK